MSQVAGHPKVKLPSVDPSPVANRTDTSRYSRLHSFRAAAEPPSQSPLVNRRSSLDVKMQSEQHQHQATHHEQSSEKVFTPLKSLPHPHHPTQHSPGPGSVHRRRRRRRSQEREDAACRLGSKLDESVRGQLGWTWTSSRSPEHGASSARAERVLSASSARARRAPSRTFSEDLPLPEYPLKSLSKTTSKSELGASSARARRELGASWKSN